jgi:hypothetical protein
MFFRSASPSGRTRAGAGHSGGRYVADQESSMTDVEQTRFPTLPDRADHFVWPEQTEPLRSVDDRRRKGRRRNVFCTEWTRAFFFSAWIGRSVGERGNVRDGCEYRCSDYCVGVLVARVLLGVGFDDALVGNVSGFGGVVRVFPG